ncbi:hypothetical protein TI39_contig86g00003 [Zymoseptoria brevis]|uniref:Uncharacterized protein n=1 Tax=Zymoseptoria brevis TaxID=1047168 RepID=A0A0F4GYR6_9PEZI|nr:hypothetical protein TI39_contig86g00003 [Zymoseptoria brevis]
MPREAKPGQAGRDVIKARRDAAKALQTAHSPLQALAQELRDMIFEFVVTDDNAVYCHTKQGAFTHCGLILVDKATSRDYRAILDQRKDQLRNHRITLYHNLDPTTPTPEDEEFEYLGEDLPNVDLNLPACATGLHVLLQVEKTGVLSESGPYYDKTHHGFPDISQTFDAVIADSEVERLLIEVEIIDSENVGEWNSRNIRLAHAVYKRLRSDMKGQEWTRQSGAGADSTIQHAALIMHNATGFLVRRDDAAFLSRGTLWTRRTVFKKRALALLDSFNATDRVRKAIRNGPRIRSVEEREDPETDSDWDENNEVPWSDSEKEEQKEYIDTKRRVGQMGASFDDPVYRRY